MRKIEVWSILEKGNEKEVSAMGNKTVPVGLECGT